MYCIAPLLSSAPLITTPPCTGSTHRGSAPITPEGSLSGGPLPSNSPNGGTAHPTPSKGIDAAMEGLGLGDSLPEGAPVPMSGPAPGLLSQDAQGMLDKTTELDYQTQIVFRMFENKRCGHFETGGFGAAVFGAVACVVGWCMLVVSV